MKNWTTTVSEGTKIRMHLPIAVLDAYKVSPDRLVTRVDELSESTDYEAV